MGFVNEQDDRLGRSLDFVNQGAKSLLEFPYNAGSRLQQSDIERAKFHVGASKNVIIQMDESHEEANVSEVAARD